MRHCPITYDVIAENQLYSDRGLRKLNPQLKKLFVLDYSAEQQRQEAIERAGKMSIQGVQPKLSAQLKVKAEKFELVDQYGHYILKLRSESYRELPENEAVTMSLAEQVGIEVPIHGLLYSKDNSMTYFIKRFDRYSHHSKYALEDFGQLLKLTHHKKYNSSMENVAKVLEFCSAPKVEAPKLFKLILFNFLVGNEDAHVKNFSLITRNGLTTLSPAYDLLNTTIAQRNAQEELALPLNGKKKNLTQKDFFDYFAREKLNLNDKVIQRILNEFSVALPQWRALLHKSFLSDEMKIKYSELLEKRCVRIGIK